MRFLVKPRQWYVCEFFGDDVPYAYRHSPIKVFDIKLLKSGKKVFELSFYHANYPEGVRDKKYRLQTIERASNYILAMTLDHSPVRYLYITGIDWEWLKDNFRCDSQEEGTIENWLEENV